MDEKSELGRRGEAFASEYLKKLGWHIIERNHRKKWGELDIIAVAPDRTLVFVEVKTLRQAQDEREDNQLMPEDEMTKSKVEKFTRAAQFYAGSHEELIDDRRGWRLDVLALTKSERGEFDVRHYENI